MPWRGQTLRLLSVGRLTYYKGFETLVRAVAPLAGVQLLIAGAGEMRTSLQALAQSLTPPGQTCAVQLLGEVDESAAMVCFMASEECSFTTASTFDTSGGRTTF